MFPPGLRQLGSAAAAGGGARIIRGNALAQDRLPGWPLFAPIPHRGERQTPIPLVAGAVRGTLTAAAAGDEAGYNVNKEKKQGLAKLGASAVGVWRTKKKEGQDMKLFCVLLQVGFVAVCFGVEPVSSSKPQDEAPVYGGKTLGQWTIRAKDWDPQIRTEAATALGEMGPAAIPALTEFLKGKDCNVCGAAGTALAKMGPAAIPALRELLKDGDWSVRSAASTALGEIDPAVAPTVAKLLRDKDVAPARWGRPSPGGNRPGRHPGTWKTAPGQGRQGSHRCYLGLGADRRRDENGHPGAGGVGA